METVKASEFKAKCLKLMDKVAATGDSIVITKNGTPVAELVPVKKKLKTLIGAMKGSIKIAEGVDIVGPIATDAEWDVEERGIYEPRTS